MLVIGLAGGALKSREAVARALVERGGQQFAECNFGGENYYARRVERLEVAIDSAQAGRPLAPALVFTHLLTEGEAQALRRRGGYVWHVLGPVSVDVVIRLGDQRVTERPGGERHWLDPLEALSEVLLQRAQAAR